MTGSIFLLLMQLVTLTKAGFINNVDGSANVAMSQSVDAGVPIRTETSSYAEVLLNPGSYLRLGESSEAVLKTTDFDGMALEIRKGSALIEAVSFEKQKPLSVTDGKLHVEIIEDGLYLFTDNQVQILEGKVRAADTRTTYKKQFQISKNDTYQSVKIGKRQPSALELWSMDRSAAMARANAQVAYELRSELNVRVESVYDVWLRGAGSDEFAYMPSSTFRTPYGQSYISVKDVFVVPGFYYNPAAPPKSEANETAPVVTPTLPVPAPAKRESTGIAGK